jgi:hypothetical protein
MLNVIYTECPMCSCKLASFAKCRYAECHYAECRGAIADAKAVTILGRCVGNSLN